MVETASIVSTTTLPWFALTAPNYYFGLWFKNSDNTAGNPIFSIENNAFPYHMEMIMYTPTPSTPSAPSPTIDTGGFFGPIIKALVGILTRALAYLMQFLGYVWQAMQIGLDILGGFLGIGAIGTAITNAFSGVATWITQVIASVFSNVANIATSVGSAITAVGQLTTNFFNSTFGLGAWLTQLGNMASQFWSVMTTLGLYGRVGISFLLAAWMLWGAVLAYQDIDKFWNQWYRTTGFGFLWIFKILWWSGEAAYGIMLKIKSLIWPTGSGGGIVQAPA